MTDRSIDLFMIEIVVADWSRSRRWYVDVLGLEASLEDVDRRFLLLEAGPGRVAIKEGAATGDRSAVRLIFQVPDVAASRDRLKALGVEVGAMTESDEGYREIRLRDPDGTPIYLFSWVDRPA